jgi:hypothetical protein
MSQNIHRQYYDLLGREIDAEQRELDAAQEAIRAQTERVAALRNQIAEKQRVREFVGAMAGIPTEERVEKPSLVTPVTSESISGPPTTVPQRHHYEVIAEVLEKAGRPLRVKEIIDAVAATGQPLPDDPSIRYSAIYAALHRRKGDLFRKNSRAEWELRQGGGEIRRPTTATTAGSATDGGIEGSDTSSNGIPDPDTPTYAEAAAIVIKECGRPVRTSEIADWMINKGYKNQSKRRFIRNTIYNCLNRSDHFRQTFDGRWVLAVSGR